MEEKKSSAWIWVLLAVIIFVFYCLTMQRPYCQTIGTYQTTHAVEIA